jgi:hypothetical protein
MMAVQANQAEQISNINFEPLENNHWLKIQAISDVLLSIPELIILNIKRCWHLTIFHLEVLSASVCTNYTVHMNKKLHTWTH